MKSDSNLWIRPELLLHPLVPTPLHGTAPRTVKGKKWWDEQRAIAYAKHADRCHACGIHKSLAKYKTRLEAHEAYNINYATGRVVLEEIVALCHCCHSYIHSGLLEVLLHKKKISLAKANYIVDRGNEIVQTLPQAVIVEHAKQPEVVCDWGDWYLEIDGEKFKGKFKNMEEWKKFYGN